MADAVQHDSAAQRPLVLVVDDDAQMRAYLRQCLDALPVRVAEARDGREALDSIRSGPHAEVALVLTDVIMPGMDGRELKAMLHDDVRWAQVPVVLVSGEALRARDHPVLRKPFNARHLHAVVRPLLWP